MDVVLKKITVAELVDGYVDNHDEGVVGYGGRLDIRPKYQREFVYKDAQRDAVIDTLTKNFPLNVMYWAVRDDGDFEVIDGQQRTISICQYVKGDFSCKGLFGVKAPRAFHNLPNDQQQQILAYNKLMVYHCTGTDSEKLEWFKTINIAGEKLTDQELRNAVYSGSWVTDAKRYFSKRNCPATDIGKKYLSGNAIRQEYLETAIKWINDGEIEKYMSSHQQDASAKPLWDYFRAVIDWVEKVFPNYRKKFMVGVDWGTLYRNYKDAKCDPIKIDKEIGKLIADDDVTNKKGIYPYVLTREEKHLNIRAFDDAMKQTAYEKQKGICVGCQKKFKLDEMHADHKKAWKKGGKTAPANCQMLCVQCNLKKGGK